MLKGPAEKFVGSNFEGYRTKNLMEILPLSCVLDALKTLLFESKSEIQARCKTLNLPCRDKSTSHGNSIKLPALIYSIINKQFSAYACSADLPFFAKIDLLEIPRGPPVRIQLETTKRVGVDTEADIQSNTGSLNPITDSLPMEQVTAIING